MPMISTWQRTILTALLLAAGALGTTRGSDDLAAAACPAPPAPGACADELAVIGGPAVVDPDQGFLHVTTPLIDPLLLLEAPDGTGRRLYALHPTADRIRVFDVERGLARVADIPVCSRPSSLASGSDRGELYVSCHGSHAVGVVDVATNRMVALIQRRDLEDRPLLQEPMGIAVHGDRLYVASSQNNRLAIVDRTGRRVLRFLEIPGQDPRALALSPDGRFLVVANFMAGNRTEPVMNFNASVLDPETPQGAVCGPLLADPAALAVALEEDPAFMDTTHPQYPTIAECYFFAHTFGTTTTIGIQPARSDHDLVVIDLSTERVVFSTDELGVDLGSLNYDVSFAGDGDRLFLASTLARNFLNTEFGNRPLLNRVSLLELADDGTLSLVGVRDLDASLLDADGNGASIAATPHAIAEAGEQLLLAAAGSDRIVLVDGNGDLQGSLPTGAAPKGVLSDGTRAWVHDSADGTVREIDLDQGMTTHVAGLGPSPLSPTRRAGRALFESARFASNRSFACASCHPDGHLDGLVWQLNDNDGLRTTMTLREITETDPYHWDGSKCNLVQILDDGVRDLFGNPDGLSGCETQAMIEFIDGLVRPQSPFRRPDDRMTASARLGGAMLHRARFKDRQDHPAVCTFAVADPTVESAYLDAVGDPGKKLFDFNGGGGPVPNTLVAESCSVANCHVAPHTESKGFRNGDPDDGLIDGFQAVSTLGMWDRMVSMHDARTTRTRFVQAMKANRVYHGAKEGIGDHYTGELAARSFTDTHFRHVEYNFDDDESTHAFPLTDALTRFLMEEEELQSGAVGLTVVLGRNGPANDGDARLLEILIDSANQGKIALRGVGSVAGTLSSLTWTAGAQQFVDGDGLSLTLPQLTGALTASDSVVFYGAPLPGVENAPRPKLRALSRTSSPVLCSEAPDEYPAAVSAGATDSLLVLDTIEAVEGTRVLIDGQVVGDPLTDGADEFRWTLPAAPASETILALQLLSPEGLLSNSLPLPVVGEVVPAEEPRDLRVGADPLTTYHWSDQFGETGPGTRYDVFRGFLGDLRDDGLAAGQCISPQGWSQARLADPSSPPPGWGYYYVVRAQNQVNVSSWGFAERDAQHDQSPTACTTLFP